MTLDTNNSKDILTVKDLVYEYKLRELPDEDEDEDADDVNSDTSYYPDEWCDSSILEKIEIDVCDMTYVIQMDRDSRIFRFRFITYGLDSVLDAKVTEVEAREVTVTKYFEIEK